MIQLHFLLKPYYQRGTPTESTVIYLRPGTGFVLSVQQCAPLGLIKGWEELGCVQEPAALQPVAGQWEGVMASGQLKKWPEGSGRDGQ